MSKFLNFANQKFSSQSILRFQLAVMIFILLGDQILGPEFYLIPRAFSLPFFASWQSDLLWLRGHLVNALNQSLPAPHAAFAAGVVLGATEGMPKALVNVFRQTGTSHMVAVSGFNVTVVANTFSQLFIALGLSRYQAFWATVLILINFALLTGAQAAVVRAALMSLIFLTAKRLGRPSQSAISVTWAALGMLIFNPTLWRNDLGFQLSFLSTLGLIYFSSWFASRLPQIWPDWFKESMASTLAAILMTTPIILFTRGQFSAAALPANLLVVPTMSWLMLFDSLSMFCGLVHPLLGRLIGLPAYLVSSYILAVLNFFAKLDFASFPLGKNNLLIIFSYGLIFLFYRYFVRPEPPTIQSATRSLTGNCN